MGEKDPRIRGFKDSSDKNLNYLFYIEIKAFNNVLLDPPGLRVKGLAAQV